MARILIIDDEPAIRRSVRKILELSGHEVDESEAGPIGIAMHVSQRYDVIITDLNMPNFDGVEVVTNLRSFDRGVNIVLITGEGHSDVSAGLARLGAIWILPKPFNMKELAAILEKAVRR